MGYVIKKNQMLSKLTIEPHSGQTHTHTCASVDKEADDHADGDHTSPGLEFTPSHAVKHWHTAHMTLRDRESEKERMCEDVSNFKHFQSSNRNSHMHTPAHSYRHSQTQTDTWKLKQMVGMAFNTALQEDGL